MPIQFNSNSNKFRNATPTAQKVISSDTLNESLFGTEKKTSWLDQLLNSLKSFLGFEQTTDEGQSSSSGEKSSNNSDNSGNKETLPDVIKEKDTIVTNLAGALIVESFDFSKNVREFKVVNFETLKDAVSKKNVLSRTANGAVKAEITNKGNIKLIYQPVLNGITMLNSYHVIGEITAANFEAVKNRILKKKPSVNTDNANNINTKAIKEDSSSPQKQETLSPAHEDSSQQQAENISTNNSDRILESPAEDLQTINSNRNSSTDLHLLGNIYIEDLTHEEQSKLIIASQLPVVRKNSLGKDRLNSPSFNSRITSFAKRLYKFAETKSHITEIIKLKFGKISTEKEPDSDLCIKFIVFYCKTHMDLVNKSDTTGINIVKEGSGAAKDRYEITFQYANIKLGFVVVRDSTKAYAEYKNDLLIKDKIEELSDAGLKQRLNDRLSFLKPLHKAEVIQTKSAEATDTAVYSINNFAKLVTGGDARSNRESQITNKDQAYTICRQLLEILRDMYKAGIKHGDLHYENFKININQNSNLQLKIFDWGLAEIKQSLDDINYIINGGDFVRQAKTRAFDIFHPDNHKHHAISHWLSLGGMSEKDINEISKAMKLIYDNSSISNPDRMFEDLINLFTLSENNLRATN